MASDTKNVKLGVCQILFGGYDLGYTKGGVEVEVKTETKKVMVDQFGNSEINEIIMGRTVTAKVPMAETTLYNLAKIMPGTTVALSGGAFAVGTITVNSLPVANSTLTINGYVITSKTLANTALPNQVTMDASRTTAQYAQSLVTAINTSTSPLLADISAEVSGSVVTLTASVAGVAANSYGMVSSSVAVVCSAATMLGGVDPGRAKVTITSATSTTLIATAKHLILHPIANADTDRSGDFSIPLANTPGDMQMAFKLDEERIYIANFTGYPDSTTGVLFVVGDMTIPG